MKALRLSGNPMITPNTPGADERMGENINGPSLIRAPQWLASPLGKYYLYFAHHRGTYIRLAYADDLEGPWRIHPPGTLSLEQTNLAGHIASPDVHVDHENRRLVMYYHGNRGESGGTEGQPTQRATSADGLNWQTNGVNLGPFYFRVFQHGGWYYALAHSGRLLRSRDPATPFEERDEVMYDGEPGRVRHWAVHVEGDTGHLFFSRWYEAPEHILYDTIDLTRPWTEWRITNPSSLLKPEYDWEGANLPIKPSYMGPANEPLHELHDPAVFVEDNAWYLLYSVAAERGIAIARLQRD